MPTLSQIYVYPVKSLAGIQVNQWPVEKTGLRYDRKWMLIDDNGQFLSQRRLPRMALIKTRIADDWLTLSAPGQEDIMLPLHNDDGDDITVGIWDDTCLAKTVNDHIDAWLCRFLDCACRLVYFPDDHVRKVDPRYATENDQTAFSDGFPFLIVSESSLRALNQAMNRDMSMVRFRPNLVISGCDSYAEDSWRQIMINGITFRLPKPCSRCMIPNINPESAISGKEPLSTLSRLRLWQNKVYFGQNALHDSNGILSIGDDVEIIETGDKQPLL